MYFLKKKILIFISSFIFALFFFSLLSSVHQRRVYCHYFHLLVKIVFSDLGSFNCCLTYRSMCSSIIIHYMPHTANRMIFFFFPVYKSDPGSSCGFLVSVSQMQNLRIFAELVVWNSPNCFYLQAFLWCTARFGNHWLTC